MKPNASSKKGTSYQGHNSRARACVRACVRALLQYHAHDFKEKNGDL